MDHTQDMQEVVGVKLVQKHILNINIITLKQKTKNQPLSGFLPSMI